MTSFANNPVDPKKTGFQISNETLSKTSKKMSNKFNVVKAVNSMID